MSRVILIFLILTSNLFAQTNHMLIMGGGGESSAKSTTIFDGDIRQLGRFLDGNHNWKPTVGFDGGHPVTEMTVEAELGKRAGKNQTFTETSYERMISDFEMKIASGEIKAGDQLMVMLSTHGAQNTPGVKTHKLAVAGGYSTDLSALTGAKLVSLDRLENLAKLASSRGVKLAILNFSCHSGNALKIANPKTCIISSTGPDHFGYSSYGEIFIRNMKSGRNLEDVFLETFRLKQDRGFPMISTPTGKEIHQELYRLMTPYLYSYHNSPGEDKLKKFLDDEAEKNKCEEGIMRFAELDNLLSTIQKIERLPADGLKNLREALKAYHDYQNQLRKRLIDMRIPELYTAREKFCSDKPVFNRTGIERMVPKCDVWTHKELLSMNFPKLIKGYEKQKTGIKQIDMQFDALINNLKKAEVRRDLLLFERPEYKDHENFYKTIPNLEAKTEDLANRVSRSLESLYENLYRSRAKVESNPCRDFKL